MNLEILGDHLKFTICAIKGKNVNIAMYEMATKENPEETIKKLSLLEEQGYIILTIKDNIMVKAEPTELMKEWYQSYQKAWKVAQSGQLRK